MSVLFLLNQPNVLLFDSGCCCKWQNFFLPFHLLPFPSTSSPTDDFLGWFHIPTIVNRTQMNLRTVYRFVFLTSFPLFSKTFNQSPLGNVFCCCEIRRNKDGKPRGTIFPTHLQHPDKKKPTQKREDWEMYRKQSLNIAFFAYLFYIHRLKSQSPSD